MTTTSWTSADVAALEAAIKKGVKSVTYQSGTVTYHSLAEMLTLLDRMRADVASAAGTSESQLIFAARVQ